MIMWTSDNKLRIPKKQIQDCLYRMIADNEQKYNVVLAPKTKEMIVEKLTYSKYYEVIEDNV